MHASAQPNGRSPKRISGSMSTSPLKPGSDNLQNAASVPSQGKGKKRERAEHSSDPIKRERLSKTGYSDYGRSNSESSLKLDIAKVIEKRALVDIEGVDRLVQVMFIGVDEKKVDLPTRIMLVNIINGTERSDCLSRFVQIKGLLILDEWLQDVHKGKTGDSSGFKDNDKVAEEFLLVLLRALDKLPVNLSALQMCNIGKSVNHLRSHKNVEIQKKARSLVDTWKKRVETEMNMNDSKISLSQAAPWSARSQVPEVAHVSSAAGGSSESAPKSPSIQLSASKTSPAKLPHIETASKSASQFQSLMKLASPQTTASINMKDGQPHTGSGLSNVPLTTSRDEMSNSSSPSHNSSQTCSDDHVKNGGTSVKEDARSSAALNKMPCLTSHHRKSVNGNPVSVASPLEAGPSRTTSLNKNVALDKASLSGLTSEKASDVASEVNSHKFIMKIPNRSHSPAQRAAGVSDDDSSAMNSKASSLVALEKDQLDSVLEDSSDASQVDSLLDANAESWRGNDFRDSLNAVGEGNGPDDPRSGEEHLSTHESSKTPVVTQSTVSSPRNILKLGEVPEASMSPMSALIESCVNYAKADEPGPIVDDMGMHLLASVAAGETIKSELAPPAGSPYRNPSSVNPSHKPNNSEMKPLPLSSHSHVDDLSKNVCSDCTEKDQSEGCALTASKEDDKTSLSFSSERPVEEKERPSCANVDQLAAPSPGSSGVFNILAVDAANTEVETCSRGGLSKKSEMLEGQCLNGTRDAKVYVDSLISSENRAKDQNRGTNSELESEAGSISSRGGRKTDNDCDYCGQEEVSQSGKILSAETNEKKLKTADGLREVDVSEMAPANKIKLNEKSDALMILEVQTVAGPGSGIEEQVESKAFLEKKVSEPVLKPQADLHLQDMDVRQMSQGCGVAGSKKVVEMEQCNSSSTHASIAGTLDRDTKVKFDLNEGFSTDDGKFVEAVNTASSSTLVDPLVGTFRNPTSSSSASLSAPIAVSAATAKGPFVPPDDLLRAKVEIGWKGFAATSAFRPAEPRKVPETPTSTTNTNCSPDISLGKQTRPPLDFDLNVADERIIEDAGPQRFPHGMLSPHNFRSNVEKAYHNMTDSAPGHSTRGLGLDLNSASEASTDGANSSIRNGQKVDVDVGRDFDLNNEPVVDASEPSISGQQQLRSTMPAHQPPLSGLRVNGAELGNFSTWLHAGNSYSAVPVPTVLSERGDQSFPIVAAGVPSRAAGPSAGGIQFNPDIYRGPVLSSSPCLSFPPAPFQYSVFPYGTNFPLPSATLSGGPTTYVDPSLGGRLGLPPVHSQILGSTGPVTSHFSRPYMVNLSDGSGYSSSVSSKKWIQPGLDLNMGSGGPDLEGRDETSLLGPKQLSIGGPKGLAEEQARMNQVNGGLLKRKEPEVGWGGGYRQFSWQQ